MVPAVIVGGVQVGCLGDLSSGENFSGFGWLAGRFALFGVFAIVWPVIAAIAERMAEHMGWIRLKPRRIFLSVLFLAMLSVAALIAYDVQAVDCAPADSVIRQSLLASSDAAGQRTTAPEPSEATTAFEYLVS
ncbi:hypothetical protein Acor_65140 [Acrocarpospora corrugata]|uniref:Uncharacterized protein n=1 Tax=Acrocarpospora corrugata TaxID=35763 RepID=A0A5M3W6N2_9ACTN|nr:hypothetical protein [Acrocarpospora corrugata]GES04446.1 hypothetical protein Acor_65140 [Acrocarpospora corrugata]